MLRLHLVVKTTPSVDVRKGASMMNRYANLPRLHGVRLLRAHRSPEGGAEAASDIAFLLQQALSRRHKFITLPIRRQCAQRGSNAFRRKILRELRDIATSADEP
jgi:hypothetical protein